VVWAVDPLANGQQCRVLIPPAGAQRLEHQRIRQHLLARSADRADPQPAAAHRGRPKSSRRPYSLSKAITEDIGWAYRRAFGIEAVNLRFAGVWRESHYEDAMQNGLPRSQSWADDLWGWVHVQDWMQCIAAAADVADPTSEPITIGAPDTKAPENTLDLIRRFKPEFQHELREPLPGRAPLLSITRARSFLGYEPSHTVAGAPLREG
jgi:UDP-glucose 4-epimerase